ncbi:Enoyl- reductase, mitochondrial [Erysiphe neolycopersici]|uniref:enoyl-[acyl-carrier-protein] reductase n=1 Tax=Erysiphe neolycopersici TaxID=212602 RepID=A0A420HBV6_9PEZI|nr:Enoyl- reductase, mitochondrial [Erysiphe neolycopersici]
MLRCIITNFHRAQLFHKVKLFRPIMNQRSKSGPFGYIQTKALVFSKYGEPNEVLSLHQHSITPSIPPNSIVLKTLASPINPADINQIQGTYPSRPAFTPLLGTTLPCAVAGNEGCFEVVSIGSLVTTISRGDWVVIKSPAFGTWRTHALAQEDDVLRIEKEGISPIQAATISVNPCTAYRLLKDFENLDKGDWWIQNGANSGVGRAAIQLGKIWGLRSINVIRERSDSTSTEALRKELLDLGATHVLTEKELMDRNIRDRIMELTDGGKENVKLGLNCVGGKATTALVKCLGKGGHLVTYGGMARQPLQLPTGRLIFDDLRFSGFWVSRWAADNPEEKKRMLNEILNLIRIGSLRDNHYQEIKWTWDTELHVLKDAIRGTLDGYRSGKSIFTFIDT